jgi:hypothetical protein
MFRKNLNFKRSAAILAASLFIFSLCFMTMAPTNATAQDAPTLTAPLGVYNVIQDVIIEDGQLYAVDNQDNMIPIDLTSLGRVGGGGRGSAAACPILNLELGAINLNLLGLEVQTSDICLEITALPSQGLLGNLLCGIARLLDRGFDIGQIFEGLTTAEQDLLTETLQSVINGALNTILNDAVITGYELIGNGEEATTQQSDGCTVLDLVLGPLDLNILGLRVYLHDCADGPVTVTITAIPGGGLLGNLLCGLLFDLGGILEGIIGGTLQDLVNQLLDLLNQEIAPV